MGRPRRPRRSSRIRSRYEPGDLVSDTTFAPGWSYRSSRDSQALPPDLGNLLADLNPLNYPSDRGAGSGWTTAAQPTLGGAYPLSLTFDGSSNYVAATSPPVVDHSAAVPYTIYAVVRPSAADVANTTTICSVGVDGFNYWAVQYRPSGVLRIIIVEAGSYSLNDATPSLQAGTTYVLAFEFASLTEINIWVDGVEDTATVTSRDPGNLLDFSWGRGSPLSSSPFYSSNTLLRGLVYSGAYSADVTAYLAELYDYSPSAAPDAAFNVLSDWDPSFSYTVDRTAALVYAESGTGISRVKVGGNWCAEFDGAGALASASSPFAALSDLSGGVSVYVVADRTNVAASQLGVFSLDDTANTPTTLSSTILGVWNNASQLSSVSVYDPSGVATSDSQAVTTGAVRVLSYHATTTARTAKVDGTGEAETSGTERSPASIDRVTIGAYATIGYAQPFVGRIYRVLICEGAYNADVTAYLQGIYTPPRIPDGVAEADVLFLWDPEASYTRDWAGSGQNLTATGTITETVRAGHPCAEFAVDSYYSGTPPFSSLPGDVTIYGVGEVQAASGIGIGISVCRAGAWTSGGIMSLIRDSVGGGAGAQLAPTFVADYKGGPATPGTVYATTAQFSAATVEAWLDGVSNGSSAHAAAPTAMDQLTVGESPSAAGYGATRWYYLLMVSGTRDTAIETWLAANFPVGETP